jgi:hypothetical protein
MVKKNPQADAKLSAAIDKALEQTAILVALKLHDNLAGQSGSGVKYKDLPNVSSKRSKGKGFKTVPQAAEYSVKQSGGMADDVTYKKTANGYVTGFINTNLKKTATQEFGSETVRPRANLYRTVTSKETKREVKEELRKK